MISIIIPVYNADRFLEECLDSVCGQTCRDLEILLVDDGSTDNSPAICDSFARKDPRVRVFHNENSGASQARNFGIEKAKGEYVMFFDSDDYAEPDLCEKLLFAIESEGTDYAFCGYKNVASAGITDRLLFDGARTFRGREYRDEVVAATLGLTGKKLKNPEKLDKLTPIWARIYKRKIIVDNDIKYVDLKKIPSECLMFNFEYCLRAESASYVHEPLYYYRRNTGVSLTKHYREGLWERWRYWIDYAGNIVSSEGDPEDLRLAFNSRLCSAVIPLGGNAMKKSKKTERIAEMRQFLEYSALNEAFEQFDYSYCPFYWKLFFYSAKKRRVHLFYILTWSMRKILTLRKN